MLLENNTNKVINLIYQFDDLSNIDKVRLAIYLLENKNFNVNFNIENIINIENYYRHSKIGMNEFELLLNSDNTGQYIKIRIFIFNLFTKK